MRIPRIYEPDASAPGDRVELNTVAARHVTKVLRLTPGAPLILFDGEGHAFKARLESLKPARTLLEDYVESAPEPPLKVELLQALSRGAKMDLVVQKAVELGAAAIVPVVTERSVMRLDARAAEKKRAHWQSIAISACEQCGRDDLPAVAAPTAFGDALAASDADALQLLLDPDAPRGLPDIPPPSRARLLIGPEGGLTAAERDAAVAQRFVPVRFGPRVLRTETAALTALAVIQHRWGDL
ncbi:MAG TPA: 16S rRNA (uracil(1498)-N(3))-methyltransferase [Gammaproteobacteria bacterium]|nr:16S rRNA (uracil(1498)-N(3))-methyltransferase [Gammaproteobacteria bacterium]